MLPLGFRRSLWDLIDGSIGTATLGPSQLYVVVEVPSGYNILVLETNFGLPRRWAMKAAPFLRANSDTSVLTVLVATARKVYVCPYTGKDAASRVRHF
jgi:hypothetical protein